MEFLLFFACYFAYVWFGSYVINGWFNITRGNKKVMPDGVIEKEGKIFKDWYFFWFAEKEEKKKVYYTGERLKDLISNYNIGTTNKIYPSSYREEFLEMGYPITEDAITEIQNKFHCTVDAHESGLKVYIYHERPDFLFPAPIRTSLAGCITCHSSWLGSIVYWVPVLLIKKGLLQEHLLPFTDYYFTTMVLLWIAYCISVACVVNIVFKKMHNG